MILNKKVIVSLFVALFAVMSLASCKERIAESQIVAQVGKTVLTVNEMRMHIPLGLTGADSINFVKEYADRWVDDQVMYLRGVDNLPDIDQIEKQVEEYRRNLISQNYENELLRTRISDEVLEEECAEFYNSYSKQLKLDHPIIQGVFIKLLANSSKVGDVRNWLKSLNDGKTDCIEELDQYGKRRAADYDNFLDTWVDIYRLTAKLPETVVDAASFLKCKTYEMKDQDYYYLFLIKDYRVKNEVQPFEYAKPDIVEILIQQKRQTVHSKLHEDLTKDGIRTGFVKKNY